MIDKFLTRIASYGKRTAFIEEENIYSYDKFCDLVDRKTQIFSELLASTAPKVIYLISEFSFQGTAALLALLKLNHVVVPISQYALESLEIYKGIARPDVVVDFSRPENPIIYYQHGDSYPELVRKLLNANLPGMILFSSGSTGIPKGIVYDFSRVLARFSKPRNAYVAMPFLLFDHFGGVNTILGLLSSGGTAVIAKDRSPSSICECIQKNGVELLPATPSFLNQLLVGGYLSKYSLQSLKLITYGTEPMSDFVLGKISSKLGNVRFLQTYGLSEVGVLPTRSKGNDSLWIKIGGEGFLYKIVEGVLYIKSEFSMLGYLNAPNPFDQDGYFNTNDMVEVDGDYVKILGRKTDLINVAGLKVYPAEVEDFLLKHSDVLDAVVYGERNSLLGSIIVAKIYCHNSIDLVDFKRNLRNFCSEGLEKFKTPQKFIFVHQPMIGSRLKKPRVKSSN